MPRYTFVGDEDTVFADLTHGQGVTVRRDGAELVGEDGEPLAHTVVLSPGDELEVDREVAHPWLRREDPDDPADDAHAGGGEDGPEESDEPEQPKRAPRSRR